MTGYVFITGSCYGCKKLFSFHPNKVPSLRVNGMRMPFCKHCIDAANPKRIENGLPVLTYSDDAYEGCPEEEVNWND